ncbi:kinase-like domain-containing protein [Chaetomium sp. MPI-SDFR-AT-0129]|nr:kinase-like domain-containing protein [Chaetomium sp. MPI-SDFR-AT-0129]
MSSYSSADDTYDSDEPPELDLDLAKLIECATQTLNAECTAVRNLTRGVSHEVFTLQFQEAPSAPDSLKQAGFSCIARFSRLNDTRAKSVSEIATARYLRQFSSIPVPEIYYYDLNPDNGVGAPFILMQRMPGWHLNKIWDTLSLDGKKSALSEIAAVIAQLSSLKFDHIGSLDENGVGPLISPCFDQPKGPFSSSSEYMRSFISIPSVKFSAIGDPLQQAGDEIERFLYHDYLQPPFCLIHADFDGQNMLFANSPDGSGPKLTGLIDFEYAYTGPLYFLYEYPIFIQDVSWSKELYTENAILRAHFIRAVWRALPDTAAQSTFISSMNGKNFALNGFRDSFMTVKLSPESLLDSAKYYVQSLKDGTEPAYSGRLDYTPERYTKTADPLPYGEDSDNGEDGGKNLSG